MKLLVTVVFGVRCGSPIYHKFLLCATTVEQQIFSNCIDHYYCFTIIDFLVTLLKNAVIYVQELQKWLT